MTFENLDWKDSDFIELTIAPYSPALRLSMSWLFAWLTFPCQDLQCIHQYRAHWWFTRSLYSRLSVALVQSDSYCSISAIRQVSLDLLLTNVSRTVVYGKRELRAISNPEATTTESTFTISFLRSLTSHAQITSVVRQDLRHRNIYRLSGGSASRVPSDRCILPRPACAITHQHTVCERERLADRSWLAR